MFGLGYQEFIILGMMAGMSLGGVLLAVYLTRRGDSDDSDPDDDERDRRRR